MTTETVTTCDACGPTVRAHHRTTHRAGPLAWCTHHARRWDAQGLDVDALTEDAGRDPAPGLADYPTEDPEEGGPVPLDTATLDVVRVDPEHPSLGRTLDALTDPGVADALRDLFGDPEEGRP